ncbi:Bug family tripartite tricarboxylate transporter substrate binding protein [Delftia tsuruhatensis]|uniref:Bug family tripartite tricarboxylate transporter substrate binding protein n=1 Tax=Delftia tsuruhatensis TaxID=180282 RepID=UPI003F73B9A1
MWLSTAAAALAACALPAWAQKRGSRLVVPFAPGGGNDVFARQMAHGLNESFGYGMIVENKAGAGGNLGTEAVVRAAGDGGTWLLGHTGTVSINPSLYPGLKFNAATDLQPVAMFASSALLLVVPASSPVRSVADLAARAKAQPGKINFASGGSGTVQRLAAELFRQRLELDMVHVPYKSGGPAIADVMGGQVDFMFGTMAATYPLVTGGKLRALAVAAPQRSARLPDVPTVSETVIPGYEAYEWNGIFLPTGTPEPVAARLHQALSEVLQEAEVRQRLSDLGAQPMASTPAEFAAFLQKEDAKWGEVVRKGAIVLD